MTQLYRSDLDTNGFKGRDIPRSISTDFPFVYTLNLPFSLRLRQNETSNSTDTCYHSLPVSVEPSKIEQERKEVLQIEKYYRPDYWSVLGVERWSRSLLSEGVRRGSYEDT